MVYCRFQSVHMINWLAERWGKDKSHKGAYLALWLSSFQICKIKYVQHYYFAGDNSIYMEIYGQHSVQAISWLAKFNGGGIL